MAESLDAHLDALYAAATAAREGERYAAVAELLAPYLLHRPQHGWAWQRYGDALGNLGLWTEAERALTRAIELIDSPFGPHVRLARLYRSMGDHEAAERHNRIATSMPEAAKHGWVWIVRGANLARLNRLEEALACHRRALTMGNADHDEAYHNIGLILRAQGKYAESIDALRCALAITPDYDEARDALASLEGIDEAVRLAGATPAA